MTASQPISRPAALRGPQGPPGRLHDADDAHPAPRTVVVRLPRRSQQAQASVATDRWINESGRDAPSSGARNAAMPSTGQRGSLRPRMVIAAADVAGLETLQLRPTIHALGHAKRGLREPKRAPVGHTRVRATAIASGTRHAGGGLSEGAQTALAAHAGEARRCPLCGQAIRGGQDLRRLHGTAVHARCTRARPPDRATSSQR